MEGAKQTESPDATKPEGQSDPGWYEQEGGLRYHDGSKWTENYAPGPSQIQNRCSRLPF